MFDVLLVEDDENLNHLFTRYLLMAGYQCESVHSVHQAVSVLQQDTPRLIILDLELDDGDGIDILSHVNRQQTQVIVVSGRAFDLDNGLDEYHVEHVLLKPVNPRGLSILARRLVPILA